MALHAELLQEAAALDADPAPATWRGFAIADSATPAYVAHRVCSSVVHAGGIPVKVNERAVDLIPDMIDSCAFIVGAWAAPVLESLALDSR